MRRQQRWAVAAGVLMFLAGGAWFAFSDTEGGGPAKPLAAAAESPLPIRQVVLFNSGVAYLQREGHVQDDASVNLSFSTDDMNDLLKSMVLQDLSGGRVSGSRRNRAYGLDRR